MCAIIGFDSPTLTEQEIRPYFDRTISRGPDMSRMEKAGRGMLGFHRLAIMGLHEEGMQPFHLGGDMAVCNGELYGFRPLKRSWRPRATPSRPSPTASSFSPSTASTAWRCSPSSTPSLP